MKSFEISVSGKSLSEVLNGIDEARRWIEQGYSRGQNENEDGEYSFTADGDYEEDEVSEYVLPTPVTYPVLPAGFSDNQLKDAAIALLNECDSKLTVIKFVKDQTGWGLIEAKRYCDSLHT